MSKSKTIALAVVGLWFCGVIKRDALHKPFPRAFSRAARPSAVRRRRGLRARGHVDWIKDFNASAVQPLQKEDGETKYLRYLKQGWNNLTKRPEILSNISGDLVVLR